MRFKHLLSCLKSEDKVLIFSLTWQMPPHLPVIEQHYMVSGCANVLIVCLHQQNVLIMCLHQQNVLIMCLHQQNMVIVCLHQQSLYLN